MKARLVYMNKELRQLLGLHLWEVFEVKSIQIVTTRHKYQRESKQINCKRKNGKHIMFYWYEVELLNSN
jgi:hypothetical protein